MTPVSSSPVTVSASASSQPSARRAHRGLDARLGETLGAPDGREWRSALRARDEPRGGVRLTRPARDAAGTGVDERASSAIGPRTMASATGTKPDPAAARGRARRPTADPARARGTGASRGPAGTARPGPGARSSRPCPAQPCPAQPCPARPCPAPRPAAPSPAAPWRASAAPRCAGPPRRPRGAAAARPCSRRESPKVSACTRAISERRSAPRRARADARAGSRRAAARSRHARGAIGSSRQTCAPTRSGYRLDPVDGAPRQANGSPGRFRLWLARRARGDHRLDGRSSPARAEHADASRRIPSAWRRSRTSRSSARMRSSLLARRPGPGALVPLGLPLGLPLGRAQPGPRRPPRRPPAAPDLGRHGPDRRPPAPMRLAALAHHPHRPLAQPARERPRRLPALHDLSPSRVEASGKHGAVHFGHGRSRRWGYHRRARAGHGGRKGARLRRARARGLTQEGAFSGAGSVTPSPPAAARVGRGVRRGVPVAPMALRPAGRATRLAVPRPGAQGLLREARPMDQDATETPEGARGKGARPEHDIEEAHALTRHRGAQGRRAHQPQRPGRLRHDQGGG